MTDRFAILSHEDCWSGLIQAQTTDDTFGLSRMCCWLYFLPKRRKMRRQIRKKLSDLDNMLPALREKYHQAQYSGQREYAELISAGIYLLDLERDLLGLMLDALVTPGARQTYIAARLIAVQLYEASQNYPKLMGKFLKDVVATLPEAAALRQEIGSALRPIHLFYGKNRTYLRSLKSLQKANAGLDGYRRHAVVAHLGPRTVTYLLRDFESLMARLIPTLDRLQAAMAKTTL